MIGYDLTEKLKNSTLAIVPIGIGMDILDFIK